MKKGLAALLTGLLCLTLTACSGGAKEDTKAPAPEAADTEAAEEPQGGNGDELFIGLSMPTFAEERWTIDTETVKSYCEEKGIKLVTACADGDSNKQKEQVSTMITQGINVLILAPNDGDAAAAIVEEAKAEGVYVISYDRLVTGTDLVDVYITFNSWRMGQINGEYIVEKLAEKYGETKGNVVLLKGDPADSCAPLYFGGAYEALKPFIDSGDIHVISENDCVGWKPEEATKHVENAMSIAASENITIDAILAPNDGTANGAIAALGDDLAKETIITGMDAEAAACQRILAGTQSMTSWGDTRKMGRTAVDLAIEFFETGSCTTTSTEKGTDADGNEIDVPAYLLDVTFIDKDNVDLLIDEGYHSKEDIYN
ncbi:MAG: sugar ABC transporter substrate-binding protein [Lachnospiraceae bacterium]|jgi:D-xylose transport system substrate-binding protein|nr:sugar ABC transporter substrate-binding protein [Lachnospiraceae bacterium]